MDWPVHRDSRALRFGVSCTADVGARHTYELRMRAARRQLAATRHVRAAELPQQSHSPDRAAAAQVHSAVAGKQE